MLPVSTTIAIVIAILAVVGTPWVARGVRSIVAAERESAYAEAARAAGASPWRVLTRHLLPATRGYVVTQATLLFPAVVVAEATLSFVGLGLPDTVPAGHGAAGDGQRRRARRLPVDPAAGCWPLSRYLVAECVSL